MAKLVRILYLLIAELNFLHIFVDMKRCQILERLCVVFDIPCLPPSHHSFTPMHHKLFIFLTFFCLEAPENGDVIYGRPLSLWRLFARYVRWFINNQTPPDKFNAK